MAEIEIEAVRENLKTVFDFVLGELRKRTDDRSFIKQMKLCVEEIFINISSYAYQPDVGTTRIVLRFEGDITPVRVYMTFTDTGHPFDPLSEEEPDVESGIDERRIGGLGIFLVKNAVDGISYEYANGQNILTLIKNLQSKETEDPVGVR